MFSSDAVGILTFPLCLQLELVEATVASKQRLVRAKFDYDAVEDNELSFNDGDYLTLVADDSKSGWWLCELRGKSGYIPSNYVELVSADAEVRT